MTTGKVLNGKPYAGNPHVWFDEVEVALAAAPRRGSLLYNAKIKKVFAALLFMAAANGSFAAKTLYVVPPGTAGNVPTSPYDSLETAATSLADAVGASSNGDTILVRKGTYSFSGLDVLTITKGLPSIRSYDPDNDGACNKEETIFDGTGFAGTDAAIKVDSLPWMDKTKLFTIEGFTFTNFPCTALCVTNTGGYFGKVAGCVFANNGGAVNGGAIRFFNCQGSVVTNCQFSGNVASGKNGGAIFYDCTGSYSVPISVVDCSFCGGSGAVANKGGAIYAVLQVNVSRCTFRDLIVDSGSSSSMGGAIYCGYNSVISDCLFTGTMRGRWGQVIAATSLAVIFSNCTFTAISANGDPSSPGTRYGLLRIANSVSAEMFACAFTNNVSIPGAVFYIDGQPSTSGYALLNERRVRNCLFAANSSEELASLFQLASQNASYPPTVVDNCTAYMPSSRIIAHGQNNYTVNFRNCVASGTSFGNGANAVVTFANCATTVEAMATDGLAYVANPGFSDASAGDYTLKCKSPLRDAGAILGWMDASATDLAGAPRVFGDAVDIGCYENQESQPGLMMIVK